MQVNLGIDLGASNADKEIGYRILTLSGGVYAAFTTSHFGESSVTPGVYFSSVPVAIPDAGARVIFGESNNDIYEVVMDGLPVPPIVQVASEVSISHDIELYQGEAKSIDIHVTNDDGTAKNMTGASVSWQAFATIDTLISKSTSSGLSIVNGNGVNDVVRISFVKADSANIAPGVYMHECRVALNGSETVVKTGVFIVNESKTT